MLYAVDVDADVEILIRKTLKTWTWKSKKRQCGCEHWRERIGDDTLFVQVGQRKTSGLCTEFCGRLQICTSGPEKNIRLMYGVLWALAFASHFPVGRPCYHCLTMLSHHHYHCRASLNLSTEDWMPSLERTSCYCHHLHDLHGGLTNSFYENPKWKLWGELVLVPTYVDLVARFWQYQIQY